MASILGAITTAVGLWLLSGLSQPLPPVARGALFGAGLLALALRHQGVVSFPLPQAARQISRDVFDRHPLSAAARFGFALGTGVRTYLVSPLPYAPALGILLLGPPLVGAVALGLGFGLARGLVPTARAVRTGRSPAVSN